MLDYYDRILSIYLPAAELYARCLMTPVRIITTDHTTFTASAAPAPLWRYANPQWIYGVR